MTTELDPRFRDQLAGGRDDSADWDPNQDWREHVAAEVEARVQAAASQRAVEMQAALDRVEAVCRELDASFRGSNIMGRIRRAAALASPAPAPRAEEGQ